MTQNVSRPAISPALIGTERQWPIVVLLTLVTFGIYGLVYTYKVFEEAKRYGLAVNPIIPVTSGGAAIGFLFIPFFNLVWGVMLWFKVPGLVTKLNQIQGRPSSNWGFLGFLHLVPVLGQLIILIIIQPQFNAIWREQRAAQAAN